MLFSMNFVKRGRFPGDLHWKRPAIKVNNENCGGNKWTYASICPIGVVYVCGSPMCHLRNLAVVINIVILTNSNDTNVHTKKIPGI